MIPLEQQAKRYARVIEQLFIAVHISGGTLATVNRGARHLSFGLRLSNPNDLDKVLKLAENVALASNSKAVLAQRIDGLVVYQFQLSEKHWQSYTRQDLPTTEAIGLAEQRRPVEFRFTDSYPHALFAGTTGSGKTEAIKSALVSLMTSYSVSDLKLVICDPVCKLDGFDNEVHLALPIAHDVEELQQALRYCYNQFKHRKQNNIKDAAILCLVYDEVTESLFDEADFQMLKTLAKQGRNFKIHLVVGTQKPSQKELPGIVDMLLFRFVGLVENAQISAQLTGKAGLECHKLTGEGDFIHVAGGLKSERFQVAQVTRQDFISLERGEVKPVVVEDDVIILPDIKPVGRPSLEVQPDILAHYWLRGPSNISIDQARKYLGLTRTAHNLHKEFCKAMGKEYKRLWRLKNGT